MFEKTLKFWAPFRGAQSLVGRANVSLETKVLQVVGVVFKFFILVFHSLWIWPQSVGVGHSLVPVTLGNERAVLFTSKPIGPNCLFFLALVSGPSVGWVGGYMDTHECIEKSSTVSYVQ